MKEIEMSELLKINVNEHTERKNGLTYLSWAWAWAEVLKIDPKATWEPIYFGHDENRVPYCALPDGSMLVGVRVNIKEHAKECLLPVMDHRNKAIKNPDAFSVNTAMMRCLAKCIAFFGLGLYIYAGEDLPQDAEPEKKDGVSTEHKVSPTEEAFKRLQPEIQTRMRKLAAYLLEQDSPSRMLDVIDQEQLDSDEKAGLWSLLDSKTRAAIKKAQQEIAA
jgi:hypothetical protein